MSIPTKKLGDGDADQTLYGVTARKLSEPYRFGKYVSEEFRSQPSLSAPNGYGDPTGVTGDKNRCLFRNRLHTQYHVKGTQTLLGPLLDVDKGLDISQDQTDNDGVEHIFGCLGTRSSFAYTVPDYARIDLTFRIADVSGTDDCAVGFRKNEAFQANIDDYNDGAWLNVILGEVYGETIVGNAATLSTDSTQAWADDATHKLSVRLIGAQVAYFLDDVALTALPAYSFTAGLVVNPFFFFLQATTTPGKVWWTKLEVGRSSEFTSSGLAIL